MFTLPVYHFIASCQLTEATRNGLLGKVVVGLAVQVWHTLIVPAQILGQYSEDEGVPWTTYRIADL